MRLENVFQEKVEKLPKEKKLEVITSKETTIKDLESYFEQNKYKDWLRVPDKAKSYLNYCMEFLQTFEIRPETIKQFNKRTKIKEDTWERQSMGLYLTALIQTSYNQGHNNFKFEESNTSSFGAFLEGTKEKPINIIVQTINGDWTTFFEAQNCSVTITNYTNYGRGQFGFYMQNCTIKSENKETLEMIKKQVWDRVGNNRFELSKPKILKPISL